MMAVVAYSHLVTMIMRRRGYGIVVSAVVSHRRFRRARQLAVVRVDHLLRHTRTVDVDRVHHVGARLVERLPRAHRAGAGARRVPRRGSGGRVLRRVPRRLGCVPPVVTGRVDHPGAHVVHLQHPARLRTAADDSAFLFCAASLVYLLAHRVARLETSSGWLTADIERGSRWLLRAGIALAAVAVLGGVLIGPRLPTANDSAHHRLARRRRTAGRARV